MLFNFVLISIKRSVKYKNGVIKYILPEGFTKKSRKKNFVCKEKSGTVAKVKVVVKIKEELFWNYGITPFFINSQKFKQSPRKSLIC